MNAMQKAIDKEAYFSRADKFQRISKVMERPQKADVVQNL
jgi:hypothetical protein